MNKRRASQVHCGNRATQLRELDSIFLQPWFLNKKCASAIRSLVPEAFVHKMRFYFDDWGCLVCRSKKRRYAANGMCHICSTRIQKRLFLCLQRRDMQDARRADGLPPTLIDGVERVRSARTLLSDLVQGEWSPNRMKFRKSKFAN
jgi:hypothetical protein